MNAGTSPAPARPSFRAECAELARLAWPIAFTQLAMMFLGVVDLAMVGKLEGEAASAVGAVALGNVWKTCTLNLALGLLFGLDPFLSQAFGARDARGMGLALQRGLALALGLALPVGASWLFAERGLLWFGQDPAAAELASRYVLYQLPSLPLFLCFVPLRQYLQARGILRPTLLIALAANALNAGLNWIFIFGNWGAPRMGVLGSALATSIVQALFPLATAAWITWGGLHEGAWRGWERAALQRAELVKVLRMGGPIAAAFAFELWAVHLLSLWAGQLGELPLAAHSIALNMASISFMIPLGVAIGSSARVGRLVGEQRFDAAQHTAWTALFLGGATMAAFGLAFWIWRNELPWLYTRDAAVVRAVAAVLPVVAAFQLVDGVQVVGGGVLRGQGRTRPAMVFHGIAFYVLGLPISWWLAFRAGWGVNGLWWGFATGLAVVAALMLAWTWRFGPARVRVSLYAATDRAP